MAGAGRRGADAALAAHLAAGLSCPRAAARAGVSERTVRRRLQDPAFRRRVDALKEELVARAAARLGRSMAAAARELARLMTRSADEKIRLGAAREILTTGLKARQAAELDRRLADLEARLGGGEHDGNGGNPPGPAGAAGPDPG